MSQQEDERQRQLEFEKYCRETSIPNAYIFGIFFVLGFAIAMLLKEILLATIQ